MISHRVLEIVKTLSIVICVKHVLDADITTEKNKAGPKQGVGNDFPPVSRDYKATVNYCCISYVYYQTQAGVTAAEKYRRRRVLNMNLLIGFWLQSNSELHPASSLPSLRRIH